MSRKIGIYKITNLINSKLYIGKSKDIENRYKKHLTQLKHNNHINKHFQNSFNKYGEDNFLYEIIEECELNLLNDKENIGLIIMIVQILYLVIIKQKEEMV